MPSRREFVRTGGGLVAAATVLGVAGCRPSGPNEIVTAWAGAGATDALRDVYRLFKAVHPDAGFTVDAERRPYPGIYDLVAADFTSHRRDHELADVLYVDAYHLTSLARRFPDRLVDLSRLGARDYRAAFPRSVWRLALGGGQVVAIPWDIRPAAMFYRVDLFDRAGVDIDTIETWDDYVDAAAEVKAASGALVAVDLDELPSLVGSLVAQGGTRLLDPRGHLAVTSGGAARAVETLKRLRDGRLLLPLDGADARLTAVKDDRVASFVSGVHAVRRLQRRVPEQSGRWNALLLPAPERGGSRAASYGYAGMGGLAIIRDGRGDVETAWKYVRFAMTDPRAQLLCLRKHGRFPSLLRTYAHPYFSRPVRYFDDRPVYQVFADEARHLPRMWATPDHAAAVRALGAAVRGVIVGEADVAQALRRAAARVARTTRGQASGE